MFNAATPDRFGGVAERYATCRPRHPRAVFHYLAAIAPSTRLAIDVAAGSGQATAGLRERFNRVIAMDLSARQLGAMPSLDVPRVVARAEQLPVQAHTADLIVAAQALHWFDTPLFFASCTADDFLGYLSTWSAVSAHRERTGDDPLATMRDELHHVWGDHARTARWPLRVRASRV